MQRNERPGSKTYTYTLIAYFAPWYTKALNEDKQQTTPCVYMCELTLEQKHVY